MKPIKKNLMWLIAVLMMMTMQQTAAAQTADDADPDAKYATELLKVGTAVPAFSLKTPDGKTVKLSDFKGKYLILDFWASWCPDCRKDAPNLVRMYDKFHKRGFEFLGVSFDTDKEAWKAIWYCLQAGERTQEVPRYGHLESIRCEVDTLDVSYRQGG